LNARLPGAALHERIAAFESTFRQIAATRMQGVPVLHPTLDVQAVGFKAEADEAWALGVLVTPWFMNLLRLPLQVDAATPLAVGVSAPRDIGAYRFDFIGAHEAALGGYEASSLFSPMFAFADQDAAVATAQEVLALLRARQPGRAAQVPSRRSFLFGLRGNAA
jgi:[NiFe] hydrogenase assembly HybE family chaperone